jgi:deoxyxylulose-5-phosphate synthase
MSFSSDSNIKRLILIEPYYSGALNAKLFSQINKGGYEVLQIGIPMEFIRSYGSYEENLENLNLDARSLRRQIQEFLNI